jgi:CSLREA domain-containing protein
MMHKRLKVATIVLALVLAQLGVNPTARAAIWIVDTTSDVNDGGCLLSFKCSLREAISDANANPGPDIIRFKISKADPGCNGAGVCTIQPASPLPTITGGGTTIDGYTQLGAKQATNTSTATLKIELDGTNAGGSANGLAINSAGNVIQGLVINRFSSHGINISGSSAMSNTVSGNYIGTDASGTAVLGNTRSGVRLRDGAQHNIIGGHTAGERNLISGNDWPGVYIAGSGTMSNTVSGNYIGTDASGTADLGNTDSGVYIEEGAQYNTVGGDTAGERNLISGNDGHGVAIQGTTAMSNTVSGNYTDHGHRLAI